MLPTLQIKNLQIDFLTEHEAVTAIREINITVERNQVLGIAGESGSGKSVTSLAILRLLSGTAKYRDGQILFSPNGTDQVDLASAEDRTIRSLRGKKIAMIFQEPMTSLNPVYTCGEQVAEAIRLHAGASHEEAKKRAITWFEKVKLPAPETIYDRFPHQLSGGQKQRVMIAMAMCGNPSLLICDEPTTALDVTVQKAVLDLIKELQVETGMSVILITHDLGVIAEVADKVVIMYKGRIVEEGDVRETFANPKNSYTRGLLACRPAHYNKGTRLPVVADFLDNTNAAVPVQDINGVTPPTSGKILLSARNLSVYFPLKKNFFGKPLAYTRAVDDVSLDIFRGETLGVVGESGCGKTTLGRTLLKLIEPSSGTIIYNGIDSSNLGAGGMKRFRSEMQIIFQDPYSSLNPSLTVGSMIVEPISVHNKSLDSRQRKERAIELLEKVGLDAAHYNRYPHEFSGGQRQRIVIARALALRPQFIVCDESVSALDVSVQAQVLNLLNDLKSEFGFTSMFISHDLSVIRYVSDRILVMKDGKIEESGMAKEVYENPRSDYTKKLLGAIPGIKNTV